MLKVASSQQAKELIASQFSLPARVESVRLLQSAGRILHDDICCHEDIPGFIRSTVDGYAVKAADTFGCSEAIPAMLDVAGSVEMGKPAGICVSEGRCAYVPTGGQLPEGSDAMVMVEYTEDYGDGTIGVLKATAPGMNCIFRGDDAKAGQVVIAGGKRIEPHDIGALAALGITEVPVVSRPIVGIISTGDELVEISEQTGPGQIRDVNTYLLGSAVEKAGGIPRYYGICPDDEPRLANMVSAMCDDCDIVLLSGGTSVGRKDAAPRIIAGLGQVLLHGLAVKPGKPTIVGDVAGKPVFGLPGNPVAAYLVLLEFVTPLLGRFMGERQSAKPKLMARLVQNIPSNHGREEYVSVRVYQHGDELAAEHIPGKSGLITLLSHASGYIRVPRDAEGMASGQLVEVIPF